MSRSDRRSTGRFLRGRVLFRADASHRLGFGHVARLLALVEEVEACGGEPVVMFGGDTRTLPAWMRDRGLHATVDEWTASKVLLAVEEQRIGTAFLDGPGLADELADKLVAHRVRTVVLDDQRGVRQRVHAALNHNVDAPALAHLYPHAQHKLLGRRYLLLRREIRKHMRGSCVPQRVPRPRILITFGGSDPVGATARTLRVLPAERPLELVVIAGPGFEELADLRAAMEAAELAGHTIDLHRAPEDPGALFVSVDAAICSAGGTLGELAYLGCPAAAYAIVPDQVRPAEVQAAQGLIHGGGRWDAMTDAELSDDLRAFLDDDHHRDRLRHAALHTADSDGPRRVIEEALLGHVP